MRHGRYCEEFECMSDGLSVLRSYVYGPGTHQQFHEIMNHSVDEQMSEWTARREYEWIPGEAIDEVSHGSGSSTRVFIVAVVLPVSLSGGSNRLSRVRLSCCFRFVAFGVSPYSTRCMVPLHSSRVHALSTREVA